MKKIGVISDSHGDKEKLSLAVACMKDCDVIVHLGDHAQDALGQGREILTVAGNCDWFSKEPIGRKLEIEGVKIYMTHGHRENVKMGLMRLYYKGLEEEAQLVLYGHTHIQRTELFDGLTAVNPGALKDGNYIVIEIENGAFRVEPMSVVKGPV